MTTAHVEKFVELAGKDRALLAKLGLDKVNANAAAAAASAAAFITNASKQAKALGLEFTEEEAGKLEKLAAMAAAWEFQKFAWYGTLAADNAATSKLAGKDPALLAKLGFDKVNADAASAAAFITNAVKQAKALGLEFTEEESRKLEKLAAAATEWEFEKFEELVDSALLTKLGLDKVNADAAAAAASASAFITNAVKEAKALGLQFTEEEAHAFMAAEAKAAASGELTDTQLQAVAGGSLLNTSRSNKRPKGNIISAVGGCLVAYED